jgi:hypothetical protein|tara:strand:- start:312 stop:587 length:276 start_codon:yes stop_codon:yes gene_type:complete
MKEQDLSTLNNEVTKDNDLKEYIINYVGQREDPEDEKVTVSMVVDALAEDFPELVLCISEENWVRGYQQALTDVEEGEKYVRETNEGLHKE